MHFYRNFWGAIYIPFFVRLPVTNAWNCHSLYTAFSSNVGTWGMWHWACSSFLSLYKPCDSEISFSKVSTEDSSLDIYLLLKRAINKIECMLLHSTNACPNCAKWLWSWRGRFKQVAIFFFAPSLLNVYHLPLERSVILHLNKSIKH